MFKMSSLFSMMFSIRPQYIRSFCRSCVFRSLKPQNDGVIKIHGTRLKHQYPVTGKISCIPLDESSARAVVFSLRPEERSLLMTELQKFNDAGDMPEQIYPTAQQLKLVFSLNALPFIGFGFLDNLLMIIAGEYIDTTFSAVLGISTMAAAALGNLISDVAGVGSASYVELLAGKVGIEHPQMTPQQFNARRTRWTANIGKAIGVGIGCVIGMLPLLFIKNRDKDVNEDSNPP